MLILASICDIRTGKIYNWITYPAILIGLFGHFLIGGFAGAESTENAGVLMNFGFIRQMVGADGNSCEVMGIVQAFAGMMTGFCPMLVARSAGGIGGGDLKAMTAIGALTGWKFTLSAMFYGLLVALLMSIVALIVKRTTIATIKRIGRFLLLSFLKVNPSKPTTEQSVKIPIGAAFCIGAALVLILTKAFGENSSLMLMGI